MQAKISWIAIALAAALGLAGDLLLRTLPLGLNLALWAVGVWAGLLALGILRREGVDLATGIWLAISFFFLLAVAWRDSSTLKFFSIVAALAAYGFAICAVHRVALGLAGFWQYLLSLARSGISILGDGPRQTFDAVREVKEQGFNPLPALRGLAIAIPCVLVFGALFASADARFEGFVTDIFDFDIDELFAHGIGTLVFGWLTLGLLTSIMTPPKDFELPTPKDSDLRLGGTESIIVMIAINAIFLLFVIFQIPYLFGGDAYIGAIESATYAGYARRGFFELVTAAGLVLCGLLAGEWLLRNGAASTRTTFRVLATSLLGMVFVVLASAFHRMWLYQQAYGLTELRLYSTAFMIWLALVLGWLLATVIWTRRERFMRGAVLSAFAALFILLAINPDALIARVNLARADEGRKVDVEYLKELSADAIPTIMAHGSETVTFSPYDYAFAHSDDNWRTWSLSRYRAWKALTD